MMTYQLAISMCRNKGLPEVARFLEDKQKEENTKEQKEIEDIIKKYSEENDFNRDVVPDFLKDQAG